MGKHRFYDNSGIGLVGRSAATLILLASTIATGSPALAQGTLHAAARPSITTPFSRIPLAFEPNEGQATADARFIAHAGDSTILLRRDGITIASAPRIGRRGRLSRRQPAGAVLTMKLEGAAKSVELASELALKGKVNYLVGERAHWVTNLPTYGRVRYRGIYPGIDLVCYGKGRTLEYDYVVAPGASPKAIRMRLDGGKAARLQNGDVAVRSGDQTIMLKRPEIYQEIAGARRSVEGRYTVTDNLVALNLGAYDHSRPLVIDPVEYATCLGGSGADYAYGIAVDAQGEAFVTGLANSQNFPTTAGAWHKTMQAGFYHGFVTKLSSDGSHEIYSTYFGGNGSDAGYGIAVDAAGNAYVTGETFSSQLPTTWNALQKTITSGAEHAFLLELNPAGTAPLYYSYIAGNDNDNGSGIRIDNSGRVYVCGASYSSSFPTSSSAFQKTPAGGLNGFLARFDPVLLGAGPGFVQGYCTMFGGSGDDAAEAVAINDTGIAAIEGYTKSGNLPLVSPQQSTIPSGFHEYVAKFDTTKSGAASCLFSTYFSGSDGEENSGVQLGGIAIDPAGNVIIGGYTSSTTLPVTPGCVQSTGTANGLAFVASYTPTGQLSRCTYLGGVSYTDLYDLAVDPLGNIYLTGSTASSNFPQVNPVQQPRGHDAYVTVLDPTLSTILFSTEFGGSGGEFGYGIAVDPNGTVYIAGSSASTPADMYPFPSTPGAFQPALNSQTNAYVAAFGTPFELPAPTAVYMTAQAPEVGEPAPAKLSAWLRGGPTFANLDGLPVQFFVDGNLVGSSITANGVATVFWPTSVSVIGSHTVKAMFNGNAYFDPALAYANLVVVNPKTTLKVSNATGTLQSDVNLSATLTGVNGPLVGETVHFLVDEHDVGAGTTNGSGVAEYGYLLQDPLAPGAHTLVAVFEGDGVYNPANSGNGTLTVKRITTQLTITNVTGKAGQTITLTAKLTDSAGGIVGELLIPSTAIGIAPPVTTGAGGVGLGSCTILPGIAPGTYQVTWTFSGKGDYGPCSGTGTLKVIP
jgi:hypothetical protein